MIYHIKLNDMAKPAACQWTILKESNFEAEFNPSRGEDESIQSNLAPIIND